MGEYTISKRPPAVVFVHSAHWNGARCPELVAGSGKQVEVVVWSNDVQCLRWVTWSWGRSPYHTTYLHAQKWRALGIR